MCPTRWITESARKGLLAFLLLSSCVLFNCTGCYLPLRGVALGEGFLDKQLFFEFPEAMNPPVSSIRSLSEVRLGEKGTRAIAVLGYGRGYCLNPETGEVLESLTFEPTLGLMRAVTVDMDGHGTLGVLIRDLIFSEVQLVDRTGKEIWNRAEDSDNALEFFDADVGNADKDGIPEFYVASTQGLYCLDPSGKTRWVVGQENDYWSVAFDQGIPGKEPPSLIAMGSYHGRPGSFTEQRSTNGDLVHHEGGRAPVLEPYLLRWATDDHPLRLLDCGRAGRTGGLWILDERGRTVDYWPAVGAWLAKPDYLNAATFIQFEAQGPIYLAVLFGYTHEVKRSLLAVYSLDGLPVYKEWLPPHTMTLLTTCIERYSQSGEVLLVGGRGERVAVYTLGKSSE
jgi:hypothetical protein